MTRQQKTPRQRAEEALALAERAVNRLTKTRTVLREHLAEIDRELDAAVVRRDYLATNPDLRTTPTEQPTPSGDDT